MRRSAVMARKSLIFVHRWLGVGLSLLFLVWFTSGIVMMYWDFPGVRPADRLERSPALDASKVRLSPAEAFARCESRLPATQIRLAMFDGRPVYRFRVERGERVIYADTGEEQKRPSPEMMQRVASAWTGQPIASAKVTSIQEVDQWTVQGALRSLRPMWQFAWPNGEQVYVSGISGEVVQYTTSASRFWAWLGPIPHWIYFTPLRKHQAGWSQFVIWTSGVGTIAAILGIAIGVWVYSPAKRYRYAGAATGIPYRGQKRWHTIFGLIFGLAAATWAFSGMLSMDPFPARTGGPSGGSTRGQRRADGGAAIAEALRGKLRLAGFESRSPREALTAAGDLKVKELELTSFAGEAVYLATAGRGETRVIPVRGEPRTEFGSDAIVNIVKLAVRPDNLAEVRVIADYDAYYLDRTRQRPLPVVLVRLNDSDRTRYYIDPKTARIAGNYSSRAWTTRWLYHGLHSLDFPWLYKYRPLWDIVMISLLLGGAALCVTSLILAWRVVRRKLAAILGGGAELASEELKY